MYLIHAYAVTHRGRLVIQDCSPCMLVSSYGACLLRYILLEVDNVVVADHELWEHIMFVTTISMASYLFVSKLHVEDIGTTTNC